MRWTPPDIEPVCAIALGNVSQCTSIGFTYLALLAHLFGNPIDEKPNEDEDADVSQTTLNFNNFQKQQLHSESKRKSKSGERRFYDFIIVGAGSAGCVLANRLSEVQDWQILLLEAGEEEPNVTSIPGAAPSLAKSSIDWGYKTQPENMTCLSKVGQSCVWSSGKAIGGSSTINYMVYMRGSRSDYDGWAAEGNVGWSYEEVLPYFEKSVTVRDSDALFDSSGPLNVERFPYVDATTKMIVQAYQEQGFPYVNLGLETKIGVNINLSTSKNGKRQSANVAYVEPIKDKRPNLHIITNAFATKVLIDPVTKIAQGVEYYKNGAYEEVFAKKEVIVSTGGIGSSKLLKVSGIGPQDELENLNIPVIMDLKVGYNLQNHVTTDAFLLSFSNRTSTLVNGDQLLNEVQDYYDQPEDKHGPLSTTSILNSVAFLNTNGSKVAAPNIQYHFDPIRVVDFYTDPPTYIASNIFPLAHYNGCAVKPLLLTPLSTGVVLLNKTDPIFSPPLIYSGFFKVQEDLDTMIEAMNIAVKLEETEVFKSNGAEFIREPVPKCTEYKWGSYDYFACLLKHYTSTIYHPVGTCRMGPSWDEDAVVDPRFRVYGIKNLRVIDASTMRRIVRGNTNAPTIMMAEKGSDMIKEDHNIDI